MRHTQRTAAALKGIALCTLHVVQQLDPALGLHCVWSRYLEAAVNDGLVSCIDAEDPALSSWCRYINHAPYETQACNLDAKVDFGRKLIWFEALRKILPGEEMHFDYGSHYGTTAFA